MASKERENDYSSLTYEHQRLELEYEIVRDLSKEFRQHGRHVSADCLDEANTHLARAILGIKESIQWIDTVAQCEQIKMNL